MSELASWSGRLAITGIGMATPVGLSAPASLAALRARISRLGDLPWFEVPNASGEPQPATGAQVPLLPANRQGPARLLRLAESALREAVTGAGLLPRHRCALFLGTAPANPARRLLPYAQIFAEALNHAFADSAEPVPVQLIETGRAAALQAMRLAAQALTGDRAPEVAIAGGVDSLISPLTLRFLHANGRLRAGPRSTGILPGEGAGFVVLETLETAARRGRAVLAFLEATAGGTDPTPVEKPTRAVVLGRVLRAVAPAVSDPAPLFLSDLNGERHRAYEWMFAACRAPFYHGGMAHWRPAESIGDAGAASGAVTTAWAVAALQRGYAGSEQAVVWGASDEGPREALVLRRAQERN